MEVITHRDHIARLCLAMVNAADKIDEESKRSVMREIAQRLREMVEVTLLAIAE